MGAFSISCWVLGVLAFLQVMGVAVGLAVRSPQQVTGPDPEPKIIYVPIARAAEPVAAPVPQTSRTAVAKEEFAAETEVAGSTSLKSAIFQGEKPDFGEEEDPEAARPAVARTPSRALSRFPEVPDPVAERLVDEAREASLRSDHLAAVIKLQEALALEPNHPTVRYFMGRNFEAMGLWDQATESYLAVHQAGPIKAGVLWRKVARKLEQGIVPVLEGLANLGPVRTNPEQRNRILGTKHSVVLPVAVAPSADFDSELLRPVVHFFEKQKGELKQVILPENAGFQWLEEPVDWADGEELVEVWYHIPLSDTQQQHLFGDREFHGFVAELYYDNQLLDIRAQPRPLVAEMRKGQADGPGDGWDPAWDELDHYEPGDPLLPALPAEQFPIEGP